MTTVYQPTRQTSLSFSVTAEHDKSTIADSVLADPTLRNDLIALGLNPETNAQSGTLNALKLEGRHATTDNLLDSRNGYILSASVEQAGRTPPGRLQVHGGLRGGSPLPADFDRHGVGESRPDGEPGRAGR